MNKVLLTGRLTREPEIRSTGTTTVGRFSLAVNRDIKKEGQPDADFINCVCFGKTAEFIEKYVNKGMKLEVEGSWQTGSYKKDDGTTVYTNDCLVDRARFAESKASQGEAKPAPKLDSNDGFMTFNNGEADELPFV